VKHVLAWVVTWVTLFWLWLFLAGDWNQIEWVGAASCATVAATVGEIARTRAGISIRIPPAWIGRAWTAPLMVPVDFCIVMWTLFASIVRREIVRGEFRAHAFNVRGDDPESVGIRAWANLTANYSPNAYVIDIDRGRGLVLFHDLVPFSQSEEPMA
jgi:hypothetical protein